MVTEKRELTSDIEKLLAWADDKPWARAMMECPQDPEWHAEGDVWAHTQMVCRALAASREWIAANEVDRVALSWAALLHDVGKPARTVFEDGRWRSPGHARAGAHLGRRILSDAGFPVLLRERVVRLIACHMKPPFVMSKPDPEAETVRLSWQCEGLLLHALVRADTLGRISSHTQESLDNIELWRAQAEELGAFASAYPFASDDARVRYFRGELGHHAATTPWAEHAVAGEAIIMCGLPGAGKDTWLRHSQYSEWPVVSLDEMRTAMDVDPGDDQGAVVQAAREQVRQHLRTGTSFAFSATNVVAQTRRQWIDLATDYQFRVHLVYVDPGMDFILTRNQQRQHRVPTIVIQHLFDKLEVPSLVEAHFVTMVV